jgi:stress response protein YsnF
VAEEHAEEAVVAKKARVTEEVALRKEQTSHTENVSDTVRHTEVEIEDERDTTHRRSGTSPER